MLTAQRKKLILARLVGAQELKAKDLALELGISEDTIRRDMRELAAKGLLQRVHGGALPAAPALGDLAQRQSLSVDEKSELGNAGASLVRAGQMVFLDGGTTALQVARHLNPALRLTVVTHSPTVALELAGKPQVEVIMLGGRLFRHSMVNMGPSVIRELLQFRADLFFMGVTGVHPTYGLTTGDVEEAEIKRAFLARAAETIVLASSEKLLTTAPCVVAGAQDVASVIVSSKVSVELQKQLLAGGLPVRTAAQVQGAGKAG